MREVTPRGPRRTTGITRYSVIGSVDPPHAVTIADIAAACAALDYGYAAWFSHQVDEVIAREEEDNLYPGGHLEHNNGRGE